MLMQDLVEYLDEIVEPTIQDFENNPTSRRHAFLACVALAHAPDYLAFPKAPAAQRQEWKRQSHEFRLIDDIAHAFKHVQTGRRDVPSMTAKEVISRPPGIWGELVWDLSRWDDPKGGVTLDKKRDIDILETLTRALKFVRSKIV